MTSTNKNSIPDTQCLKIKYIFICSMKKQMMFYSSKLRKTEKQLSQTWEERKTEENGRPNIGKIKKRHRLHFPPLGKSKMQKIIRRSWAKCRNCQKQRFACKRRAKNTKNSISLISETQKTAKNTRHPWMKPKKRQKYHFSRGGKLKNRQILRFGRGRQTKNDKNWLSATAEKLSSINFNAWQCILPQQKLNEMTVPGRDLTLGTPNFVFLQKTQVNLHLAICPYLKIH